MPFRGISLMSKGWLYVLYAAIIEIFWVLGLKYSNSFLTWTGTVIAIILSFYFIIKAVETLPSGTVYAVFTGSGAAMIAIIDFTFLETQFTYSKALLIGLIIVGVVGLQLTTPEKETVTQQEKVGEK